MKKALIVLVALFCVVGMAQAQVTNTSSPAAAIPDNSCSGTDGSGGVTDVLAFPEVGTISDADVAVEFTHTWRGDLQFHLSFAGGGGDTVLASVHGNNANSDNYFATFDDEAGSACATVCNTDNTACFDAGTAATCTPDAPLSAYDALVSGGDWTLTFCDGAGGDTGTLDTWSVTLSGDGQLPVELMGFSVD